MESIVEAYVANDNELDSNKDTAVIGKSSCIYNVTGHVMGVILQND